VRAYVRPAARVDHLQLADQVRGPGVADADRRAEFFRAQREQLREVLARMLAAGEVERHVRSVGADDRTGDDARRERARALAGFLRLVLLDAGPDADLRVVRVKQPRFGGHPDHQQEGGKEGVGDDLAAFPLDRARQRDADEALGLLKPVVRHPEHEAHNRDRRVGRRRELLIGNTIGQCCGEGRLTAPATQHGPLESGRVDDGAAFEPDRDSRSLRVIEPPRAQSGQYGPTESVA
jgi:hypothetical protein